MARLEGNLTGPSGKNARFRVVVEWERTSADMTIGYWSYRYRTFVEVTGGNFNGSRLSTNYGGSDTLYGAGEYASTEWVSENVAYGNNFYFNYREAYYNASTTYKSSTPYTVVETVPIPNHTVYYNAYGGVGAPGNQTKTWGSTLTLSSVAPIRTGYSFQGWSTTPDGGVVYVPGSQYGDDADITLYAVWSINSYYLDLNGFLDGTVYGTIDGFGVADVYINGTLVAYQVADFCQAINYGASYEIKNIVATAGHTYNGLYSGSLSGIIGDSTTWVYLNFTTNTYTVYYNANGGSGAPGNQTKVYGQNLILSSATPTLANHNFKGWSTSSTATTVQYWPGGLYTNNDAVVLYAVWELAYIPPRVLNLRGDRCDSSGNLKDDGTYARISFSWYTDRDITALAVHDKGLSASGTSGYVDVVVGGSFDVDQSYPIGVYVGDSLGNTNPYVTLPQLQYLIDFCPNGVAIGKPADYDDYFDINYKTFIRKDCDVRRLLVVGADHPYYFGIDGSDGAAVIYAYTNGELKSGIEFGNGVAKFINSNLGIGPNSKVLLFEDSEGGNIAIYSPNNVEWQMDAFNDNFRLYNFYNGTYRGITIDRNANIYCNNLEADNTLRIGNSERLIVMYSNGDNVRFDCRNSSNSQTTNSFFMYDSYTRFCKPLHIDGLIQSWHLEIFESIPYIDFHFGNNGNVDYTARIAEYSYGVLTADNKIVNSSDERFKKNIMPIEYIYSDVVKDLLPTMYQFRNDTELYNFGFIAQDVEKALEDHNIASDILVLESPEGKKSLDYNGILALLTASYKESLYRIEDLENAVNMMLDYLNKKENENE